MKILSIDIGSVNTAFYIESFDPAQLTHAQLYSCGQRVYWELVNFVSSEKEPQSDDVFLNIVLFLDKHRQLWDTCNGIIIEKQHKLNYRAQVLEHFIFGYFKALYGPFKYISNISATRKTQALGAPKKMKKPQRKKWAVEETHKLLQQRNDLEGMQILYSSKSDDRADACLQLKAFQKLVFLDSVVP